MKALYYSLLTLLLFISCVHKQAKDNSSALGEPVSFKYAQGFTIGKTAKYTVITVLNPWEEGAIYDRYYLVKDADETVPKDGKKVQIPLQSMVSNSATQLEFLQLLGVIDKVTGVCNANFIYNPFILQGVSEGKIKDLGDAFNLDIENLLMLHPQAIMTSAYNAKDETSRVNNII